MSKNMNDTENRDDSIAPTDPRVGVMPTSRRKKPNPHSKDLRKDRFSLPNQIYLITTVTKNREPVFTDIKSARYLIQTMKKEQQLQRAETLAYVVMPDHLHWLMQLGHSGGLSKVLQSVKLLTAKKIGRPVRQDGFHDHALRREEDLKAAARYIIANPVRAGLVKSVRDYPHWDAIWLE